MLTSRHAAPNIIRAQLQNGTTAAAAVALAQVKLEFQFDSLNLLLPLTFAICSRWRCITFNSIVSKFVMFIFKYGCKSPGASHSVRPNTIFECDVSLYCPAKDHNEWLLFFGCSGHESQIIEMNAFRMCVGFFSSSIASVLCVFGAHHRVDRKISMSV